MKSRTTFGTLLAAALILIPSAAYAAPADGSSVSINGPDGTPASSLVTLLAVGLLSVAPALMLMVTPFLKVFVTLAFTRQALGFPSIPPNQVLAALALFVSFFIMAPVLTEINGAALQPYLEGTLTFTDAWAKTEGPLRNWMFAFTREQDIGLILRAGNLENPETPGDLATTTLIPAFMLSELRAAMIIGFVIFVPFMIIDLVVGASLMSMGMMMLPPVIISNVFKLIFFVIVDGWGLVITSLIRSYQPGG